MHILEYYVGRGPSKFPTLEKLVSEAGLIGKISSKIRCIHHLFIYLTDHSRRGFSPSAILDSPTNSSRSNSLY